MPTDNYGTMAYVNGLWVTQCHTKSIDQELIMDSSGIDHVSTKVQMTFTGTMTTVGKGTAGKHEVTTGNSNVPVTNIMSRGAALELMNGLRVPFAYFIEEEPVFSSWPTENYESRIQIGHPAARFTPNGQVALPTNSFDWMPTIGSGCMVETQVIKVISDSVFRVQVVVEFEYIPCGGTSSTSAARLASSPVLSLRWSMVDDIDGNNWLTTRVYRGEIKLNNRKINPHFARFVVMPPLGKGFKRKRINYSESEDGLSLTFRIVDQELFIQCPYPATNFTGSWSTGISSGVNGENALKIIPTGSYNMTMEGPVGVSKRLMIGRMITLADTKLNILETPGSQTEAGEGVTTPPTAFVTKMTFSEELHKNVVSCNFEVMYTQGTSTSDVYYKIVDQTYGEREAIIFEGDNGSSSTRRADWTPENIQDDLYRGSADPYRADTSQFEIPSESTLAGVFTPAIQDPCNPNKFFPNALIEVIAQPDQGQGEQEEGEGQEYPDSGQDVGNTSPTDTSRNNDPSSPYMRYHLDEVYHDKADVVHGSHTYREDPSIRRKAGFHTQGRGQAFKQVTFSAARCNARPKIPGPWDYVEKAEEGDINVKVTDYMLKSVSATPSATGDQVLYTADGSFTALMERGYSRGERWRVNNAPTVGSFSSAFTFDRTLINNIEPESVIEYSDELFNRFTDSSEPQSEGEGEGDGGATPDPGI